MTPLKLVYTTIGGIDITPKNLMKTVWGIADAALKSGKYPGATKRELFEGFWRDYNALKEAGTVSDLGSYIADMYEFKVDPEKLPTVAYYEYKGDPEIRRRLPRGTDSGQWFITNNCFDDSPDGPNLLWLGRPAWEDGWTAEGDGNEMLRTWGEYINRKKLVRDGPVKWSAASEAFVWVAT